MKKILLTVFLFVVFVAGALFIVPQKTYAADNLNFPSLIQRLIEKFNLNKDEVENVVGTFHQERQEERRQNREERLTQAVTEGVITEEQKKALIEKQNQWQTERENQRQAHREEMQSFMSSIGIDETKLAPYMGQGKFGQRGFNR